jgi:hypothetical protein
MNTSDESSDSNYVPMENAENHTTVMVRCLHEDLNCQAFVQQINSMGWKGLYDFVYMPINFRGKGNFGYVFVNFCSAMLALEFRHALASFELTGSHECSQWTTGWSTCQGLDANVERYRNSPLMHKQVPVECKPAIFDESGSRIAFPEPTKPIPKPRIHTSRDSADKELRVSANQEVDRQVCDEDKVAASKQRPGRSKKSKQRNWLQASCDLTTQHAFPMIAPQFQGFGIDGGFSQFYASPR